jgi:hypothetical protein
MRYFSVLFSILLLFMLPVTSAAQGQTENISIQWQAPVEVRISETESFKYLSFAQATYDYSDDYVPYFKQAFPLNGNPATVKATLINPVFEPLTDNELMLITNIHEVVDEIDVRSSVSSSRGDAFAIVWFMPFRYNPESGKYEKLISAQLTFSPSTDMKAMEVVSNFTDQSVLASGDWFRIRISETGLYKVTYAQLQEMGINVSGLSSSDIRLFGNGGGMLPENNAGFRYDDLQENAIAVNDGGNGIFDPGDYFVFYGIGPDVWKYVPLHFRYTHQKNIYSDYAYYYITTNRGPGKRVANIEQVNETPDHISTTFNDFRYHHFDQLNLIKSGREWYGEIFDLITSYNFTFDFPNIKTDVQHHFLARVVAKSTISSSFQATVNNLEPLLITVSGTPDNPEGQYARDATGEKKFSVSGDDISLNLKYNKSTNNAVGWLDYFELNVTRNNVFTGGQMAFRDVWANNYGDVTEFRLSNAGSDVTIWDVTDRHNVRRVQTTFSGNMHSFTLPTPSIREFVAFDGTGFLEAEFVDQIPNQNLHALSDVEYVIVAHPDFMEDAQRLADFHRSYSRLETVVVTPQQIYNEFSSGAQDITAIKDFMRMLFERGQEGIKPRYLLLFGDASYDFKDITQNNTNFIPTYQSPNSLHFINSYATDDYFGFLGPEEGNSGSDLLDLGIGRFVVRTAEDAKMAVDKVIHYATSSKSLGNWRNAVTFVADDENQNAHLNQAEQLVQFIDTSYKNINIDKIFIDAYIQESSTGGQRYPSVNEAINRRIDKGTLIMNYTGHGGELGWAHERILEISDINSWTNYDKLTIFITATCEFARYDDPGRISAGEYVFLNPNGGGIALFTTARLTFGSSNLNLNRGIYKHAFVRTDGDYYAMGDLIRLAKLESTISVNDKKFLLIGDPALKMAYPQYSVETTFINQKESGATPDTLKALSQVTVTGRITDVAKNVVSDFNGVMHATVFDKESEVTTLGQDSGSFPETFHLRKNVLYNGKSQVVDGNFSFSFIVPKDIAYQYGFGKISYYAHNDSIDATGHYENIIIGGFDHTASIDTKGPEIKLFMNDELFVDGGITNENPVLLAKVYDESGINTVGNSIGHDIMAVLNDDLENPFILNDFYEADFSGFQQGTVRYPFSNLPAGKHELKFRIWDVFNNSSEATITFEVINQNSIVIDGLLNYPNPFRDETYFIFDHNKAGSILDVRIDIFDLSGRKVAELQQNNQSSSFKSNPIHWNGQSVNGHFLDAGIYVYRVMITDKNGRSSAQVNKLMIAK